MNKTWKLIGLWCASSLAWMAPASELNLLSDEFDDGTTLSQWQRVYQAEGWGFDQLERWDINATQAGRMVMMPHTSSWYGEWRGVQAYKPVTGDFVVTTDVTPRNRAGTGPPGSQYSLAGILARTPRPGVTGPATWTPNGENYIFLSMGAADTPNTYQFEVKTTRNSVSVLEISAAPAARARIQIARIGSSFIALRQFEGGPWVVHRRYVRADMPALLHVGLTCYTDWPTCESVGYAFHNTHLLTNGLPLDGGGTLTTANPDLVAGFEYMRFQSPRVPAALAGRNLADAGQVSDAELLAFLGDTANVPGGSTTPARIHSTVWQPGLGLSMVLELQTNRSYQVQYTGLLNSSPSWITLTNFISTGTATSYLDSGATGQASRMYRVVSP